MIKMLRKSEKFILYQKVIARRGQRISKGGGQDFKCCCVQENFEKLTLLQLPFQNNFCEKGGGEGPPHLPPL